MKMFSYHYLGTKNVEQRIIGSLAEASGKDYYFIWHPFHPHHTKLLLKVIENP